MKNVVTAALLVAMVPVAYAAEPIVPGYGVSTAAEAGANVKKILRDPAPVRPRNGLGTAESTPAEDDIPPGHCLDDLDPECH